MALSRRDFVKLCSGTVAGFGVSQMFHPAIHEAFAQTLTGEISSGKSHSCLLDKGMLIRWIARDAAQRAL